MSHSSDVVDMCRQPAALFLDIFLHAPIGIYTASREGRVVRANQTLARLLEYETADTLCGVTTALFFQDQADHDSWTAAGQPGCDLTVEDVAWRSRAGRPFTVKLTGRVIEHDHPCEEFLAVFVEEVISTPRIDPETDKRRLDEGDGRVPVEIAHDFNNLLTTILGYAELLLEQIDAAKPMHADLHEIKRASENGMALTRQLLEDHHHQTRELITLDLNEVVGTAAPRLRCVLGDRVGLVVNNSAEALRLRADRCELEQVLLNLAINGRDAMPDGGTLTIETTAARATDPSRADSASLLAASAYVQLSVTDTGTGMDGVAQARLFEPFFSTKARHRGTGLGLTIVDRIIRRLGGWIAVTSAIGQGSTFALYIPTSDDGVTASAVECRAALEVGRETILVVDDDPAVLMLVSTILTRHGYRVLTADSPRAALALVATTAVSLVVTDLVLPGMTGQVLMDHLQSHGCARVVYMSGYADREVSRRLRDEDAVFLQKPFKQRDLLASVRRVMDAPSSLRTSLRDTEQTDAARE